jgi:hypothetical protein
VLQSNVPYGMTSNRANFHNSISADFLEAAYSSGELNLARKVNQSLKKDLDEQMIYYNSLGEENMNGEQLAMQAAGILNNKGGNLSDKQRPFAYDILSTYQILQQLKQWEQQYKVTGLGIELPSDTLVNPAGRSDSQK